MLKIALIEYTFNDILSLSLNIKWQKLNLKRIFSA